VDHIEPLRVPTPPMRRAVIRVFAFRGAIATIGNFRVSAWLMKISLKERTMHTASIREHMEVLGADGVHVGVVDRVEAERVKLTRSDALAEGAHHFIEHDWIERVDAHVHLNKDSTEVMALWKRN